jgi:hypothetical protein
MAPTQDAMVVRHHPAKDERHLDLLKWPSSREATDQRPR